jgi:hypothetical protein
MRDNSQIPRYRHGIIVVPTPDWIPFDGILLPIFLMDREKHHGSRFRCPEQKVAIDLET